MQKVASTKSKETSKQQMSRIKSAACNGLLPSFPRTSATAPGIDWTKALQKNRNQSQPHEMQSKPEYIPSGESNDALKVLHTITIPPLSTS